MQKRRPPETAKRRADIPHTQRRRCGVHAPAAEGQKVVEGCLRFMRKATSNSRFNHRCKHVHLLSGFEVSGSGFISWGRVTASAEMVADFSELPRRASTEDLPNPNQLPRASEFSLAHKHDMPSE